MKEAFFEIRHSSSKKTALARKKRWLEEFPLQLRKDFAELLSSLSTWEEEIFNYFDNRFTNAFTEERNRLVKDILRETRGCHFKLGIRRGRSKDVYDSGRKKDELASELLLKPHSCNRTRCLSCGKTQTLTHKPVNGRDVVPA